MLLFPTKFSGHKDAYQSEVIEGLVRRCSINGMFRLDCSLVVWLNDFTDTVQALPSLTGDVYELIVSDFQNIVMSDQVRGRFYLTNTYSMKELCMN